MTSRILILGTFVLILGTPVRAADEPDLVPVPRAAIEVLIQRHNAAIDMAQQALRENALLRARLEVYQEQRCS
jgi:hypothetical protein